MKHIIIQESDDEEDTFGKERLKLLPSVNDGKYSKLTSVRSKKSLGSSRVQRKEEYSPRMKN